MEIKKFRRVYKVDKEKIIKHLRKEKSDLETFKT